MKKICNCNIPANLQKDMMADSIAAYVASLPKEDIVDDEEYERRLKLCSGCADLVGGLCTCKSEKTADGLSYAGREHMGETMNIYKNMITL